MQRWLSIFIMALVSVNGQIWQTGDNSTISGCSSHCSVASDGDLNCWNETLRFFETSLITQLRHYVSVQVDIDQWHRRHGIPDGQDMKKVRESILASFESQLTPSDVLSKDTLDKVAEVVSDRIQDVSDHTLSVVPHFQCPLPCEYRRDMYRNLFVASMILNVALMLSVIPSFVKSLKSVGSPAKDALMSNGHANRAI